MLRCCEKVRQLVRLLFHVIWSVPSVAFLSLLFFLSLLVTHHTDTYLHPRTPHDSLLLPPALARSIPLHSTAADEHVMELQRGLQKRVSYHRQKEASRRSSKSDAEAQTTTDDVANNSPEAVEATPIASASSQQPASTLPATSRESTSASSPSKSNLSPAAVVPNPLANLMPSKEEGADATATTTTTATPNEAPVPDEMSEFYGSPTGGNCLKTIFSSPTAMYTSLTHLTQLIRQEHVLKEEVLLFPVPPFHFARDPADVLASVIDPLFAVPPTLEALSPQLKRHLTHSLLPAEPGIHTFRIPISEPQCFLIHTPLVEMGSPGSGRTKAENYPVFFRANSMGFGPESLLFNIESKYASYMPTVRTVSWYQKKNNDSSAEASDHIADSSIYSVPSWYVSCWTPVDRGTYQIERVSLEYVRWQWNAEGANVERLFALNKRAVNARSYRFIVIDPLIDIAGVAPEVQKGLAMPRETLMRLPLCTSGHLPGRFLYFPHTNVPLDTYVAAKVGPFAPTTLALQPTDPLPFQIPSPEQPPPYQTSEKMESEQFHETLVPLNEHNEFFLPTTCRYRLFSYAQMATCFQRQELRNIHVIGDSNLRRILRQITSHGSWGRLIKHEKSFDNKRNKLNVWMDPQHCEDVREKGFETHQLSFSLLQPPTPPVLNTIPAALLQQQQQQPQAIGSESEELMDIAVTNVTSFVRTIQPPTKDQVNFYWYFLHGLTSDTPSYHPIPPNTNLPYGTNYNPWRQDLDRKVGSKYPRTGVEDWKDREQGYSQPLSPARKQQESNQKENSENDGQSDLSVTDFPRADLVIVGFGNWESAWAVSSNYFTHDLPDFLRFLKAEYTDRGIPFIYRTPNAFCCEEGVNARLKMGYKFTRQRVEAYRQLIIEALEEAFQPNEIKHHLTGKIVPAYHIWDVHQLQSLREQATNHCRNSHVAPKQIEIEVQVLASIICSM